jgi:hypothetical protein
LLKASIPSLFDSIMEEAEEIEIQVALEVHAILNDPLPNEHEKLLADLLDVEDVNGSYINDFELDGFKFIPENRTRANAEKINSWGLYLFSMMTNFSLGTSFTCINLKQEISMHLSIGYLNLMFYLIDTMFAKRGPASRIHLFLSSH